MQPMEIPVQRVDLEEICHHCSEVDGPPQALLISGTQTGEHLLAVSMQFLEDGQLLADPGLPLAGAKFDPAWGFSRMETVYTKKGSVAFRMPHAQPEDLSIGDIYGYRFCLIEDKEIANVAHELARIRAELESRRHGIDFAASARVSAI